MAVRFLARMIARTRRRSASWPTGLPEKLTKQREAKEEARIEELRGALQAQHDWHLAQGEQIFEDGKGGYLTLDMAEAYCEGALCDRTTDALSGDGSNVEAVVQAVWELYLSDRRFGRGEREEALWSAVRRLKGVG